MNGWDGVVPSKTLIRVARTVLDHIGMTSHRSTAHDDTP